MVQKTLDKLKEGTHEEKHAVATGGAIVVVVILMVAWGYMFVRKMQNNALPTIDTGIIPTGLYDAEAIRQAEETGAQYTQTEYGQLQELRDSAAREEAGGGYQVTPASPDDTDAGFGSGSDF